MTEALYLLDGCSGGVSSCLDFFIRGGAILVPLTPKSLVRCKMLMAKYANVPMDFADATLVALAEETKIKTVFTLDRRGFEIYRFLRDTPFILFP